jgi:integrase
MSPRGVPGIRPAACRHCMSWGLGFNHGLCRPCWDFNRLWPADACGACRRRLPVKKGHCRLCWCQARLDRSASLGGATGTYTALLPHARQVRHQQLFLAGLPAPRDLHPKPQNPQRGVGVGGKGILRRVAPPPAARPVVTWWQPPLLDGLARDYQYGRVDLRKDQPPDNPWLAWALHLAHNHAEARGFDDAVRMALNRVLIMLLANYNPGEMIRRSDFHHVLRRHGNSSQHAALILDEMGILIDDRQPTFDSWLDDKLAGIAEGIRWHAGQWARTLQAGDARSVARSPKTVYNYVRAVQPVLRDWSTRHEHLREITRDDVTARITGLQGRERQLTVVALRSLFGWAKKQGIIFRNPTAHIRLGRVAYGIPQPLTPEQIAPSIQAAHGVHLRLAIALAAIHAARHSDIVNLRLDDVDLGNRRLSVDGRSRPLDELTHQLLHDWLELRRRRWPNTANPHLLLSRESALHLGPVSLPWLNRLLRGLPATLERLRIDRYLDEALASGGDPLQVAEVFGVCETTAVRYADAARQLLNTRAEDHPSTSARTGLPTNPPLT